MPGSTGGGGFAGVDVADDDDVDMNLFFTIAVNTVSITRYDHANFIS